MGGSTPSRLPDNIFVASFFRKPLGLFSAIVVVGLVLIVAAMSAFGGTSKPPDYAPKPLTPAQFRLAGEHMCVSMRPQLRWLATHKPRKLRQLPKYIARATSMIDQLTTQVDRLVPPPSVAPSFDRMRRNIGAAVQAMHRLNHLTQTHQWRLGYLLVHSRWWKKMEKRLGPYRPAKDIRCGRARHSSA
jgi:hypothetical protein